MSDAVGHFIDGELQIRRGGTAGTTVMKSPQTVGWPTEDVEPEVDVPDAG
jgi:hypothetical protein